MFQKKFRSYGAVAAVTLSACVGCVERDEEITIAPDGSVVIELEYKGDEEDILRGDAMPSAEGGWNVVRTTEKDNDKIKHVLKAERRFAPGEQLPRTFAATGDPNTDLYLDFPTTVRVEKRPDGVYYYFRRVYTPRRWAYIQRWNDILFDDDIKKLGNKPVEELTLQERVNIAESFAGFEALKQLEFAKTAIEESQRELPAEYGLMARRAVLQVYERELERGRIEGIITSCEALSEGARGKCYDVEVERILGEAYAAYMQSLRQDAGLEPQQLAAFERAYQRARRYHEISEQLGGHNFGITVTMPGTIIAHNFLEDDVEVNEQEGTSTVEFTFDGKWFRDCPHELIVVSRLGDKPRAEERSQVDGIN
jgi:hypothetical protein